MPIPTWEWGSVTFHVFHATQKWYSCQRALITWGREQKSRTFSLITHHDWIQMGMGLQTDFHSQPQKRASWPDQNGNGAPNHWPLSYTSRPPNYSHPSDFFPLFHVTKVLVSGYSYLFLSCGCNMSLWSPISLPYLIPPLLYFMCSYDLLFLFANWGFSFVTKKTCHDSYFLSDLKNWFLCQRTS